MRKVARTSGDQATGDILYSHRTELRYPAARGPLSPTLAFRAFHHFHRASLLQPVGARFRDYQKQIQLVCKSSRDQDADDAGEPSPHDGLAVAFAGRLLLPTIAARFAQLGLIFR
jgi:hypothetical protein